MYGFFQRGKDILASRETSSSKGSPRSAHPLRSKLTVCGSHGSSLQLLSLSSQAMGEIGSPIDLPGGAHSGRFRRQRRHLCRLAGAFWDGQLQRRGRGPGRHPWRGAGGKPGADPLSTTARAGGFGPKQARAAAGPALSSPWRSSRGYAPAPGHARVGGAVADPVGQRGAAALAARCARDDAGACRPGAAAQRLGRGTLRRSPRGCWWTCTAARSSRLLRSMWPTCRFGRRPRRPVASAAAGGDDGPHEGACGDARRLADA